MQACAHHTAPRSQRTRRSDHRIVLHANWLVARCVPPVPAGVSSHQYRLVRCRSNRDLACRGDRAPGHQERCGCCGCGCCGCGCCGCGCCIRSPLTCSLLVQALPLGVSSGAASPAGGFVHLLVDQRMCTRPVPADGAGAADDQITSERASRTMGRARRRQMAPGGRRTPDGAGWTTNARREGRADAWACPTDERAGGRFPTAAAEDRADPVAAVEAMPEMVTNVVDTHSPAAPAAVPAPGRRQRTDRPGTCASEAFWRTWR